MNANCCNKCHRYDCDGRCPAARWDCFFDIHADPYDASKWVVMWNGMPHRVNVPTIKEKDTFLSTDYTNATLNYKAEYHTDKVTGAQLGVLINVDDLRDVDIDDGLNGNCYELLYRKWASCGDGCRSLADHWVNFNINSDGAKQEAIRYVRGANVYGCPIYLEVPTNEGEFWYGMWVPGKGFTYFQPEWVDELPKIDGKTIVMSLDPVTKKPIYGTLPDINCLLENIMGNLGVNIFGTFSVLQETPIFGADFNPVTGDFNIHWNDWDLNDWHVGGGVLYGKMDWTYDFDIATGKMSYTISAVHYYNVVYTVDKGMHTTTDPIYLTIKSVAIPSGAEVTLMDRYVNRAETNWTYQINQTVPTNYTVEVMPGQTIGPLNFAYIFNDWTIADDEGYLQVNFKNLLYGWKDCD